MRSPARSSGVLAARRSRDGTAFTNPAAFGCWRDFHKQEG